MPKQNPLHSNFHKVPIILQNNVLFLFLQQIQQKCFTRSPKNSVHLQIKPQYRTWRKSRHRIWNSGRRKDEQKHRTKCQKRQLMRLWDVCALEMCEHTGTNSSCCVWVGSRPNCLNPQPGRSWCVAPTSAIKPWGRNRISKLIFTLFFSLSSLFHQLKNFRTCFWGHGWVNKKGIQTRTGPEGWPPPPRRCCCPLPAPWGALPPAAGWCSWWSPGSRWAPPPRWTGWSLAGWRTGGWPVRWRRISSDGWNDSDEDEGGCSHLDDLQVLFAALCCQALHTAELAARCVRVMDGAADELSRVQRPRHSLDLQRLPQRVAVAGGVHHHGLGAGVDFCFHHGDFQDVRHRRLLSGRPGARLGEQLGGGLCAAERWRWTVGAAKGDLGDGGTLRDDWLRWRRFLLHELSHNYTSKHFKMTAEHLLEELNSSK